MRVRILNSNTHAGQGLREGGLLRVAKDTGANILTVQEVQRVSARVRLRRQFPSGDWGIFGLMPPSIGPASPGNHVLWQKDLFSKIGGRRDAISPQLFDSGHRDKWHPSRRLAQVRLEAKEEDAVRLAVGSDHTWTTAGHDWSKGLDRVVAGHKKQCRAQAEVAWDAQTQHFKVCHCGDENAAVAPGDGHTAYVELQYQTHGMLPARSANAAKAELDAAWVSKDVKVVSFEWIPKERLTTDHDGFLLVIDI
jgi:hypothetical protein